jgi:hypothetical protein
MPFVWKKYDYKKQNFEKKALLFINSYLVLASYLALVSDVAQPFEPYFEFHVPKQPCPFCVLDPLQACWRHAAFEQGENPVGLKLVLHDAAIADVFMTSANG